MIHNAKIISINVYCTSCIFVTPCHICKSRDIQFPMFTLTTSSPIIKGRNLWWYTRSVSPGCNEGRQAMSEWFSHQAEQLNLPSPQETSPADALKFWWVLCSFRFSTNVRYQSSAPAAEICMCREVQLSVLTPTAEQSTKCVLHW